VQHIKLHAQVFSQPVDSIAVQFEVGSLGRFQSLSLLIGHQLSTTHSQLVSYNAGQLFAHHIHLCFQARMSDESQLAPHPRL